MPESPIAEWGRARQAAPSGYLVKHDCILPIRSSTVQTSPG